MINSTFFTRNYYCHMLDHILHFYFFSVNHASFQTWRTASHNLITVIIHIPITFVWPCTIAPSTYCMRWTLTRYLLSQMHISRNFIFIPTDVGIICKRFNITVSLIYKNRIHFVNPPRPN